MNPSAPPLKARKKKPVRSSGNTQTSISLSALAAEKGKEMAEHDDRSFSKFVDRLILAAAKKRGLIKESPPARPAKAPAPP